MRKSTQIYNVLAGMIALWAAAAFAAGAPAPPKASGVAVGSGAQTETGAIFSDSTLASIAALNSAKKPHDFYRQGVQALHRGHAAEAGRDAQKAIKEKIKGRGNSSDAYALAATAELSQRKFSLAQSLAQSSIDADASNEKAYVILATADNYLGQYADAVTALQQVQADSAQWWQISYQRARAEAGLSHARAALDWSNRAALQAPQDFAPLHLLHASALVAIAQYAQAADELETYLALEGNQAQQRDELRRELGKLRELAGQMAKN